MRSLLGIVRLCIGNFDGVATKEVPWIMFATAWMSTVTIHLFVQPLGMYRYFPVAVGAIVFS